MKKRILIVGGGFGGVQFYKTLHALTHDSGQYLFQMVNRWNYFLFYPMLHEVATGSVDRSHITEPLREIMKCCLETLYHDEATYIDFKKKEVHTRGGVLPYEVLCLGLGTAVNMFGVKGAEEHAIKLKDIASAVTLRNTLISRFERATKETDSEERKRLLHFVVIGGGPTGIEMAGQLADLLFHEFRELYQEIDYKEVSISILQGAGSLIPQCTSRLCALAAGRLRHQEVDVHLNMIAEEITQSEVRCKDGSVFATRTAIWTGGASSPLRGMVDEAYLNADGYLKTRETLQLDGHDEVFVVGDIAGDPGGRGTRAPQTAQAAVCMGEAAGANCYRFLKHRKPRPFVFKSKGDIMPIGDWYAVAQIGPFAFGGRFAWWLRRTIFLTELSSWTNRIKIMADWTINIFSHRDTSEL